MLDWDEYVEILQGWIGMNMLGDFTRLDWDKYV